MSQASPNDQRSDTQAQTVERIKSELNYLLTELDRFVAGDPVLNGARVIAALKLLDGIQEYRNNCRSDEHVTVEIAAVSPAAANFRSPINDYTRRCDRACMVDAIIGFIPVSEDADSKASPFGFHPQFQGAEPIDTALEFVEKSITSLLPELSRNVEAERDARVQRFGDALGRVSAFFADRVDTKKLYPLIRAYQIITDRLLAGADRKDEHSAARKCVEELLCEIVSANYVATLQSNSGASGGAPPFEVRLSALAKHFLCTLAESKHSEVRFSAWCDLAEKRRDQVSRIAIDELTRHGFVYESGTGQRRDYGCTQSGLDHAKIVHALKCHKNAQK